jgi:hypothetical protein
VKNKIKNTHLSNIMYLNIPSIEEMEVVLHFGEECLGWIIIQCFSAHSMVDCVDFSSPTWNVMVLTIT